MKKFVKIFSLVLGLCLMLTAFGCKLGADHKTPTADEYFEFNISQDGTYYTIALNESKKSTLPSQIILPSTHDGKPITGIDTYGFAETTITKIAIPSGYKEIGGYAFYNCTKLKSIEWADSIETIKQGAFSGCVGLVNTVILPKSVALIEKWAFEGCPNLVIDIPSTCTVSDGAFHQDAVVNKV